MRVLVLVLGVLFCASQIVLAHDKEIEGDEEGGASAQPQATCVDRRAEAFPCNNIDLLADYPLGEAGLSPVDDRACLRWETRDGSSYRGCDPIHSVRGTDAGRNPRAAQ
jgi:hypothetical protein